MTTTSDTTPAAPLVSHRLRRPLDGRVFRGVCAAIGRYTNTDPVIWRVIVAVTAVFGGAGIVLYLAGWLLIPEEGSDESIAERRGLAHLSRSAGLVLITVVGVLAVIAFVDHGRGIGLLLVLAVLGWAAYRHRRGEPVPRVLAWTAPTVVSTAVPTVAASEPPATVPTPLAASRRPRNGRLSAATVSIAALVTGVLLALQSDGRAITAVQILAADVIVVGLGLVAGAFLGRPRLLVTLGLLLVLATGATAGGTTALRHGVGTRDWVPVAGSSSDYRLGSGEATLDLRELAAAGQPGSVSVHVGFGHVVVLVPADATAHIDAQTRFGDIVGVGSDGSGERVHRVAVVGDGATSIAVRIRLTAGKIEVRRG